MVLYAEVADSTLMDEDRTFELDDNATVDDLIRAICDAAGYDYDTFDKNYVLSDEESDLGNNRGLLLKDAEFGDGEYVWVMVFTLKEW